MVEIHLAGGLGLRRGVFRHGVVPGIQGDQSPNGTVDSLPDGLVVVAQGQRQVIARHIPGIPADGGQGQDDPGIFGVLLVVEDAVPGLNIGLHGVIVALVVPLRHRIAAAGQAQHRPLSADGAHLGLGHGGADILRGVRQGGLQSVVRSGSPDRIGQADDCRQGQQQAEPSLTESFHPIAPLLSSKNGRGESFDSPRPSVRVGPCPSARGAPPVSSIIGLPARAIRRSDPGNPPRLSFRLLRFPQ